MDRITFRSNIDRWLIVLIASSEVIAIVAVAMALRNDPSAIAIAVPLLLLGVGLPMWTLRSTRYELSDTELRAISGPFRWTVPLRDIRSVRPTRNPISSPALSRDRLRIEHARGVLLISPADKERFLKELDARRRAAERV